MALRTRLVAILLAALIAALALTGYAVQAVLRGYLVAQVDASLRANAVPASLTAIDAAQNRLRVGRSLPGGLTVTLWLPGSSPLIVQPANSSDRPVVVHPPADSGPVEAAPAVTFGSDDHVSQRIDGMALRQRHARRRR